MKKLIIFCFCINSIFVFAQPTLQVDERTELMSVVFRLAGAQEYCDNYVESYVADIDSFFVLYREHPVVEYSQLLRQNFAIGYDAVMSMAVHLTIENNEVRLQDGISPCDIDFRWQCDSIPKYIALLNDFYRKTEFHRFFTQHKDLYAHTENAFRENVFSNIKFEWFDKFYGKNADGGFNVIISLSNGISNYGPHVKYDNGKEEYFAIIGTWGTDSLGYPTYGRGVGSFVTHEFNHSFCNRLIDEYLPDLLPKAEVFNDLVIDKMIATGYGHADTYLYELLVRACVIRYGVYNLGEGADVDYWVAQQRHQGFLWIEHLNEALSRYELNRDKYPTLRSFMPEIVKVQNGLDPLEIYKQVIENQPIILGANIKNGAQDVNSNLDRIIINFDKPMIIGFNGSSSGKCQNCEFPEVIDAEWNKETKKEWILIVELKPNTSYSMSFPAAFFFSEEGAYNPKETYYLDFKTK